MSSMLRKKQEMFLRTVILACLASLIALPAMAGRDPVLKPSGIVIHLFGPNFMTDSNSPSGTAPSQPASGGLSSANPAANQPEPTMSQVLHQLFVTGDPAQDSTPHFLHGRAATP